MARERAETAANSRLTISLVADTCAKILYVRSAYDIAQWCDRLGMGPSNKEPFNSKPAYVRVLRGISWHGLADLGPAMA